ncbi:hypothetical protein CAPTEDRAFT_46630, partial [Capitella teleta]
GRTNGWVRHRQDPDPWLQVDFRRLRPVLAIETSGNKKQAGSFTRTYGISYSQDGSQWTVVMHNGVRKVFGGNFDHKTPVRHYFNPWILTRFLRFHPIKYNGVGCLRWELYTCNNQ